MERVVITGIGVVSPIGRGFRVFADQLLAGWCGSRRLEEVFGPNYRDVPVRYGAAVAPSDMPVLAEFERLGPHHRSVLFAADAIRQIVESSNGADLTRAGLHCGIGVGLLCPEMDDVRKYGAERMLKEFEAQPHPDRTAPQLNLASAIQANSGTDLLQQHYGLGSICGTYSGACSASTQASIAACEDVALGEAEFAIGGGHDTLFAPAGIHLMYELGTLSEDSRIRPFDVARDGTMLGEGAVYFLFERLEHARARGAHIYAEVTGWSSSLDGYHLTSPDPSGEAATRMIQCALRQSGFRPDEIDYVNAHGTATVLNDVMEAEVIKEALGGHPAYVSSTKAQVGHLIAACGAIGLGASIAAIEQQVVPPNPHLSDPDPECDVNLAPSHAIPARIDRVVCNSFGFGGQNSCLVLQRPTPPGSSTSREERA